MCTLRLKYNKLDLSLQYTDGIPYRLLSRSCAVCNFHCFGGPEVLKISKNLVTLTKQWEIKTAHDDEKTLQNEKKNFYLGKRDIR